MKVIFLDIDGVLNSTRSCIALGGFGHLKPNITEDQAKLDPIALKLMRMLVEETGANVVISSSWRILAKSISEFDFLEMPVIGFTPYLGSYRGDEIQQWLDNNLTTQYVIIDDDSDMHTDQMKNFVKCNFNYGFGADEFFKAYKILTGEKHKWCN